MRVCEGTPIIRSGEEYFLILRFVFGVRIRGERKRERESINRFICTWSFTILLPLLLTSLFFFFFSSSIEIGELEREGVK